MNEREWHADDGAVALAGRPPVGGSALSSARTARNSVSSSSRSEDLVLDESTEHARLCSIAKEQGLLDNGPAVANTSLAKTIDFKSFRSRLQNAKTVTDLARFGLLEPIEGFDPSLDAVQIDVVARALHTPDILVVQGLAGTGKSRLIAEIVRHLIRRGNRVLFLAASGAAVDAVLSRLNGFAGFVPARLLLENERSEDLAPGIPEMSASARDADLRSQLQAKAAAAARDAESKLSDLRNDEAVWDRFQELAELRNQLDFRCATFAENRLDVASQVRDLAEQIGLAEQASVDDGLRAALRAHALETEARLTELESLRVQLQTEREALEAERRVVLDGCESIRPLEEAGHSGKFWSVQFWKAKLNKSVSETCATLEHRLQEIENEAINLSARENALAQLKQQALAERHEGRTRIIEGEIERRIKAIDEDEDLARRRRAEVEEQLSAYIGSLPPGLSVPSELSLAEIRQARTELSMRSSSAEQQAEFARRWHDLVKRDIDSLIAKTRHCVNVVAAPIDAIKVRSDYLNLPFEFLITDESHLLENTEIEFVAQKANRWVLVGEPGPVVMRAPTLRMGSSRHAPVRRGPPGRDFFFRLWDDLHRERWLRDGERLVYKLRDLSPAQRDTVEIEAVADRPEIELRICSVADAEPFLAEVAFPAKMPFYEAGEYLLRELGEIPSATTVRTGRWSDGPEWIQFEVGAAIGVSSNLPVPADDVTIHIHHSTSSVLSDHGLTYVFSKLAGWNLTKADAWINEHLLKHDSGRACRLEKTYRHTPAMASWLNDAVATGASYPVEHRIDGAVQFESVPRRSASGSRRGGGAGYEIDLADPKQRELLPVELVDRLPSCGFVNLPEAQAIAELVQRLPRDHSVAISAPFPAQLLVLRHYLADDRRVFSPDDLAQRECDLLVVSLTRSHVSRAVTFGEHPAIMAGLFTRPRCRLICVGDPGTLGRRAQWEGAVDHLDAGAGEAERRWVNALLSLSPSRHPAANRTPERAKI